MKSYHFDLGNSNTGCVGLCARVRAQTQGQAVAQLRAAFDEAAIKATFEDGNSYQGVVVLDLGGNHGVEYLHVYLNLVNLQTRDIDDVEEAD